MRPHLFSPILATLLVVSATSLTAQRSAPVTLITGTVVGADGKPMSIADVHLGPAAEAGVVAEAKVGPDGRFAIATTQTGAFSLILTGVNNHSASVPLLLDGRETTIALDVQLARYRYRDTLDPITAIGDWNHFNFDTGRPLVKQADGRYTLDVESTADTVAYQLLGLESDGRSINGTEGVRYQYDGGGDYRSVIKTDNGHATIVFDPRRLDRRPSERRITFRDPRSFAARLATALGEFDRRSRAYFDSARAATQRKDSLHYDWTPALRELAARGAVERDPVLSQILLLERLNYTLFGAHSDSGLYAEVVRRVRPTSPVWSFRQLAQPAGVVMVFARIRQPTATRVEAMKDSVAVGQTLAYLDSVSSRHPARAVRIDALSSEVFFAKTANRQEQANDLYLRMMADYGDDPMAAVLRAQYSPNRVLRAGLPFREARGHDSDLHAGRLSRQDLPARLLGELVRTLHWRHAVPPRGLRQSPRQRAGDPQHLARPRPGGRDAVRRRPMEDAVAARVRTWRVHQPRDAAVRGDLRSSHGSGGARRHHPRGRRGPAG